METAKFSKTAAVKSLLHLSVLYVSVSTCMLYVRGILPPEVMVKIKRSIQLT